MMMIDRETSIRRKRLARGLSQDELAARVGVSQALISRIERGFVVPSHGVRERLARELAIKTCQLLSDSTLSRRRR